MATRQTYVIGALGMMLGMIVGSQSAQQADLVSLSGHNPNSDIVQTMPHLRRAAGILRYRSDEGPRNLVQRLTAPRRAPLGEGYIRTVRQERMDNTNMFGSAPEHSPRRVVPGCAGYSGQRYTRCLEALVNGEVYQPNYFPTSY